MLKDASSLRPKPCALNYDPGLHETGVRAAGGRCLTVIAPEDTEDGTCWRLCLGPEDTVGFRFRAQFWIWTLSQQFVLSWEDCSSICFCGPN